MNILSTGLPFGTPGEPLARFQSRRGHEVRTLSSDGTGDYHYTASDLAPELLARINQEWPVDLWLCWCPEVSPPPRQIEYADVRTVAIVSDWTIYYPQLETNLARFDLVVSDALGVQTMRLYSAVPRYFGPIYSHRSGVHENRGQDRDIDVAFAGNLNHAVHVRRGHLLEKVASLADRYKVVIASELPDAEYTGLLNRSRIAFNTSLRREMNLRCFEALACGALLFIEEDNLEIRDLLDTEEDCVLYSEENLVPLLEHFLAHPHELNHRAAHGHAKSPSLAGEARLDDLIEEWAAASGQFRSFQDWSAADRALAEVLFYSSSPEPGLRDYARLQLDEAATAFPDDLELQAARAVAGVEALAQESEAGRKAALPGILAQMQACASKAPDAAPLWLNLAHVSRRAKAPAAERRFLELALNARDTACGTLLMGDRNDPYYAHWREAMAYDNAHVDLLHAAAAARLGELRLDNGENEAAMAYAAQSEDLLPGIARPYRVMAAAAEPDTAVALLEEGLTFTAFDSDHRMALIDALEKTGRENEAADLALDSQILFSAWPAAAGIADEFAARSAGLSEV